MSSKSIIGRCMFLCLAFLLVAIALPQAAEAQFHGISIQKVCDDDIRICDTNAECEDGNECTEDICNQTEPNELNCFIAVEHNDDFGDTITIQAIEDIIDANAGPTPSPNVDIVLVQGNASCAPGPSLPCDVGPANGGVGVGRVIWNSSGYNPTALDPNPLEDLATATVRDNCDAPGTTGCSSTPADISFPASTILLNACENPPLTDSTPCTDTDGNLCTTAGCDGAGGCDQNHIVVPCPPDGNECTGEGTCNPATGLCEYPPLQESTPCTDTDGTLCTEAGCDDAGNCDQNHIVIICLPDDNECTDDTCNPATGECDYPPVQESTPCTDTDGDNCTTAGCDDLGNCDQNHVVVTCVDDGNECTGDGICNPATGLCEYPPLQESTPCTDTDGTLCTEAGCDDAGNCDQNHIVITCPPDNKECTRDRCNPATGQCDYPPVANSTPCTDTDDNECTTPGCEAGACVQDHIVVTCGPDLPDVCCDPADGICKPDPRLDPVCTTITEEKVDFIIKMTAKEKFWWNTSNTYNKKGVQIQDFDNRIGYLFCYAIDNDLNQMEIDYDYLKGDATVLVGASSAFNYNAIPSQGLNVISDRVLNLDGVEYTMGTSTILFEGFAEDAFGIVDGTLAVANIGIDFINSIQPEFNINFFCWNENEVRYSRYLHYKDFEQYDLTDDLQLDIASIFTEGFQCATTSTHALWAVFYQTAGPTRVTGGNVWQYRELGGVSTVVTLPVVPSYAEAVSSTTGSEDQQEAAALLSRLNESGSILVYPLIDNQNYQTIINIANTGPSDVTLECYMVTRGPATP